MPRVVVLIAMEWFGHATGTFITSVCNYKEESVVGEYSGSGAAKSLVPPDLAC